MRISILGAGKIGETLIKAILESKVATAAQITATAKHAAGLEAKAKAYGIRTTTDNAAAARGADVVILSVKPQAMAEVLASAKRAITPRTLVISTAAGVATDAIERGLAKGVPVVRTMPNTPCLLRSGMTAICGGRHATRTHLATAESIFGAAGRTLVLDEKHFDAVTGLSGSGPAFMYVVLEALAEGGVKVGLPRDTATELVAQTMLGSARMVLETREHPAKLKDVVTTPAGCTIDGLLALEEGGLRVALINAVVKATTRAGQLGR
jgi:pyrroline-5-carboxylate reductase